MGLQNQNCNGGKQVRDFILSRFGSSETVVVNTQEKCTKLIGMTFFKKPPIVDWIDGASENASFTLTTSNPEEDNFGGSSGCIFSFLMACNTSIFFSYLSFGLEKLHFFIVSLKQHNLLFSTSSFLAVLVFWFGGEWYGEGQWELGCQQIRICK